LQSSYLDKGITTLKVASKINDIIDATPNITAELLKIDVQNALLKK
jgi:hypothetical protein